MPTKETNLCENAVSCGGLALGLALAPRTVRVDRGKLKTLTDPMSALLVAPVIRYAIDGFLAQGLSEMHYDLFGRIISECHINPYAILPDQPKPEPEPVTGYTIDLDVADDRVSLTVLHDGKPLVYGKSYIKEQTETGVMQAISYAAYMCYKFAEQKEM